MAIPLGTGIDDEIRYTALAESWVAALATSHRNALTRVNLFRKGSAYRHPLDAEREGRIIRGDGHRGRGRSDAQSECLIVSALRSSCANDCDNQNQSDL